MTISFPAPPSTTAPLSQEIFVTKTRYGSLLGPEYTVLIGGKYFVVGDLTLKMLKSGTPLEDLDLYEIDPDAPDLED